MSLKLITAVVLALAPSACTVLEGTCETVEQEGPGMSGAASYLLGDGTQIDSSLDDTGLADVKTEGIEMSGRLVDSWGVKRTFVIHVAALEAGTYDLAGVGDACLPRQSNGPDICAPLTGTLELRARERDCYFHSSGVGTCAETLDFTISARSEWQGTVLTVDADMYTRGSWVEAECE